MSCSNVVTIGLIKSSFREGERALDLDVIILLDVHTRLRDRDLDLERLLLTGE